MSTTYTQTIEFSVWKEHTCSCCGTVYRYLFKRTMKGEGNSPEAAAKNAENVVQRALEKEVDQRACPECGLYQPDMVATKRATGHWWTFWIGTPIYGLLLILLLTDVMSYGMTSLIAGACAIPLLLAHFFIDARNPNGNREANRKESRRLEKNGDIWVPEDRQPKALADEPIGTGVFATHYLCYALLAAAVLAFFLPVGLKTVMGMKTNPTWVPEVAGPGDSVYIYFPNSLSSVKKYWRASANVTVLNPNELGGPVNISATSKNDSWGNTISVKSSEKDGYFKPWAQLQLPADGRLVGKTLQLQINMNVTFPKVQGGNMWQEQTQQVTHAANLTLSSAGSGKLLKASWWLGFVGGCALLFLAGGLLPVFSNSFKKQAYETSIFVPEGQRPAEDDDETEYVEDADDRSRRRGIRDAEPADDRPRKRRDDDYEEDDRPQKRRDDDYDDDRPRKKRRDDY